MIFYENGDVLEALRKGDINVVAHGVNISGGFNSGIAGQIKEQFPIVREKYLKAYEMGTWKLGLVQTIPVGDGKLIVNCATQKNYGRDPESQPNGRYCDYDAIRNAMRSLACLWDEDTRIGMPMIGAGLAAGDWSIIEAIINEEFGDKPVYVYKL
jgi:O-acetyl-ADP-ribose deacetylase (regulator of RNase III)